MRPLELARLESLLRGFRKLRLLVVGDLVLDEYVWGDVERVSPEAPVPVRARARRDRRARRRRQRRAQRGGARRLGLLLLGGRRRRRRRAASSICSRISASIPAGLLVAPGRPTTRKTRVVARSQQVVRFDRETLEPPPAARRAAVAGRPRAPLARLRRRGARGLRQGRALDAGRRAAPCGASALRACPWRWIRRRASPRSAAPRCSSPTCARPRRSRGSRSARRADLARAVARLRRRIGGGAVVVTRGADGMSVFDDERRGRRRPHAGARGLRRAGRRRHQHRGARARAARGGDAARGGGDRERGGGGRGRQGRHRDRERGRGPRAAAVDARAPRGRRA